MFRVSGAGQPFKVFGAVISSDFVAVVYVVVEWGWFSEEGFSDETMGEFGDLATVTD